MPSDKFKSLVKLIQTDLITLADAPSLMKFYFTPINWDLVDLSNITHLPQILKIIDQSVEFESANQFLEQVKSTAKAAQIPLQELFPVLRTGLTGQSHGLGIHELIELLGSETSKLRLKELLKLAHL